MGDLFNQSLDGVTLPESLQNLTFGFCFNHSLLGVSLPAALRSLTFGNPIGQWHPVSRLLGRVSL